MSLFRELTDVELHVRKGQDRSPISGLVNSLCSEAGSMDVAAAIMRGKPLIAITETEGEAQKTDRLVLSASVRSTPIGTAFDSIVQSIHLSKLLQSAPVNLYFHGETGVTVTATDKPKTVLHEFIRETALARGPASLGPNVWDM